MCDVERDTIFLARPALRFRFNLAKYELFGSMARPVVWLLVPTFLTAYQHGNTLWHGGIAIAPQRRSLRLRPRRLSPLYIMQSTEWWANDFLIGASSWAVIPNALGHDIGGDMMRLFYRYDMLCDLFFSFSFEDGGLFSSPAESIPWRHLIFLVFAEVL